MAVNPKIAVMDAKNKANMVKRAKAKEVPQDVRDAAKRQYKAGTPREDPNNPYTTADKALVSLYLPSAGYNFGYSKHTFE